MLEIGSVQQKHLTNIWKPLINCTIDVVQKIAGIAVKFKWRK